MCSFQYYTMHTSLLGLQSSGQIRDMTGVDPGFSEGGANCNECPHGPTARGRVQDLEGVQILVCLIICSLHTCLHFQRYQIHAVVSLHACSFLSETSLCILVKMYVTHL